MAQASSSSEEMAINLAAIQKTDKSGCEVLDKCTSSALYKYAQGKWEKCNCDGVFLLYRRSVAPVYAFIVLNKRSTQNHVQHVTKAMSLQLQSPFLLYKTESGEIHGMWFYTQRDCDRIGKRVGKLVETLGGDSLRVAEDRAAATKGKPANASQAAAVKQQPQQQQQQPQQPPKSAQTGADAATSILQMLSRAQTDFTTHRGLPQQQQQPQQPQQQQPKVISVDSLFGSSGKQQPAPVSNGGPPLQRDQYAEISHQIKEQLGLLNSSGLQQQQQQQQQQSSAAVCSNAQADEEEEEFLLTPGMLECAASQLIADCPTQVSPSAPTQSPPQPREQPGKARQQQQQQAPQASVSGDVPALTKEQLRESLLYLLENDDAFLGSLHRAYVASLQRRLASPRF